MTNDQDQMTNAKESDCETFNRLLGSQLTTFSHLENSRWLLALHSNKNNSLRPAEKLIDSRQFYLEGRRRR
jgi:hypothetical protein